MDRTKDVPEWAIVRAMEEMGYGDPRQFAVDVIAADAVEYKAELAFARYIAEHEEAPADPIEEEAQAIADQFGINLSAYAPRINDALQAALRRGIELDKEQQP